MTGNEVNPKVKHLIHVLHICFKYITDSTSETNHRVITLLRKSLENINSPKDSFKGLHLEHRNDLYALVYRHYIFSNALNEEIFPNIEYRPLFELLSIIIKQDIKFDVFDYTNIFKPSNSIYPINDLRASRKRIKNFGTYIANTTYDAPYGLLREHAVLSSVTLCYILNLLLIIFEYEYKISNNEYLKSIVIILNTTLVHMKGVFHYEENCFIGFNI